MKIQLKKYCEKVAGITLADIPIASPFVFVHRIHQKHEPDDVFMRIKAPECYLNQNSSLVGKSLCVNLKTGSVAATLQSTECKHVDAVVLLAE